MREKVNLEGTPLGPAIKFRKNFPRNHPLCKQGQTVHKRRRCTENRNATLQILVRVKGQRAYCSGHPDKVVLQSAALFGN